MYDDLSRIEACYGCVAEYNRSRFDDEAHEWELWKERQQSYDKAKENLKKASVEGLPIIYYGGYELGCDKCCNADYNTCCSDDDDIERVICRKPDGVCPKYKEYRAGQLADSLNRFMKDYSFYDYMDSSCGDEEEDCNETKEQLLNQGVDDFVITLETIITELRENISCLTLSDPFLTEWQSDLQIAGGLVKELKKFSEEGK